MLALQTTDNQFFDLPANASLDVTGSNPAFDIDAIGRVFSYPFLLPATPRNLRLLMHANRLDAKRRTEANTSVPVKMWAAGAPLENGYLNIGDVSERALECSFGNVARALLDEWDALKIRSLMPTISVPQSVVAKWEYTLAAVPYLYFITINGVQYSFDATGGGYTQNDAGLGLAAAINAAYPGTATYISPTNTLEVQALDNDPFIINSTIQGLTIVSVTRIAEAWQQNLLTYVQEVIDTPVDSHSFPTLRHNGIYGAANYLYTGYVNYWHDGAQGENSASTEQEWEYTYIPYVKVKYVFDQIAASGGLTWKGDFYDSQDFADLRIFSNYALDQVKQEWYTDQLKYLNGFKTSFSLSNHVPDITAKEFLFRVCATLNLYPVLEGTDIELRRRRDQIAAVPLEFSEYMDTKYKISMRPIKGVTLKFKDVDKDQAIQEDQLEDYVIGDGGIVQEVNVTPLYDRTISDYLTETSWRMCMVQENGSSDEIGTGITPAAFRLFFDRGIQQDSEGYSYPMSTHLDTAMDDSSIGDLSLEWDGDKGLYAQLWQGWAELQDRLPLEMFAVVPVATARDMLKWESPVIRFYHPMGETRAIVKSVQFDVAVEVMEWVKVKLEMVRM